MLCWVYSPLGAMPITEWALIDNNVTSPLPTHKHSQKKILFIHFGELDISVDILLNRICIIWNECSIIYYTMCRWWFFSFLDKLLVSLVILPPSPFSPLDYSSHLHIFHFSYFFICQFFFHFYYEFISFCGVVGEGDVLIILWRCTNLPVS